MNKSVKEDNFGNIAFDNNADKLLKLLSMIAYNHNLVSAISYNKDIFVVRKSYNRQKAQDIAYLVLFCYYILCFCRWTKSLNVTAAFRRFFQKTGLELTTYRFYSIGYYNFIIIFKREQVFRFSLFCCCLSVVSQR